MSDMDDTGMEQVGKNMKKRLKTQDKINKNSLKYDIIQKYVKEVL